MDFVRVNDKLTNEGNSLTIIPLKILQPLRVPYDAMLVQPTGTIQATKLRIGHVDQDAAIELYRNLIKNACEHGVDLLVTPEYCLPWQLVGEIVDTELRPKREALWALGCESITLEALDTLKTGWEQRDIKVLYETPPPQNRDFLCPLIYIFWVNNTDNEAKLCMLIQFKSEPCRDNVEVGHLHLGNDVYIFGNEDNELNFFSLICADVFKITPDQITKYHKDSLILHIQLNKKPWHSTFTDYRKTLFSVGSNNSVELICLNWATGFKWRNDDDAINDTTWNHIPNSAFYIPKKDFQKFPDAQIDALQKKGIYYNRVHTHWDSLFLNNEAQAILVRKQPIRFDGDQALALPVAKIQILKRFILNTEDDAWVETSDANDGFMDLLDEYKPADPVSIDEFERFKANLIQIHDSSPLAVERSLELLQGPEPIYSWHNRYVLTALELESEESPRRVTTHQEKCAARKGVAYRKRRLQASYDAATLHTLELVWPSPLRKEIGQGFSYCWQSAHPHSNVVPIGDFGYPATLIYLGSCTLNKAKLEYTKMAKFLRTHASENSTEEDFTKNSSRTKDRLCIVYSEQHQYKFIHNPDGKSIATPANQSPTSFDVEDDNEH